MQRINVNDLKVCNSRRNWVPGKFAVLLLRWRMADIWPLCHCWTPRFRGF